MNTTPDTNEPAGGDGLLFLIAFAVISVVAAEAAFIAYSSWWLLAFVLLGAIVATVGVIAKLVSLMGDDQPDVAAAA
jgi:hypothetical protein